MRAKKVLLSLASQREGRVGSCEGGRRQRPNCVGCVNRDKSINISQSSELVADLKGGAPRGICPSLDDLKQVWRPFFGNCAPLLKNENQVKKFLRPIG